MSTLNLKDELIKKNKEYLNKDDIFGMTLLTNPGYISSGRSIMFTSHLKQFVNINNPEIPYVYTNYENSVGKNSTAYYEVEHSMEIIDIIPRFEDGVHDNYLYYMFMYDKKRDRYHVIEKKIVEDLTEKFGFRYNTDYMDSKSIGDKLNKGDILYRSNSYDDDMNYRYGRNVKIMYTIENNTIEDAIVCSESFAKAMSSVEVESVKVSLNDNDIMCNLYGDNKEYKCFPDIGESVRDKIVCAKRRIHNNQILYDLKKSNLKKVNVNDTVFYNKGRVVDIHIYSNKSIDEIEDNVFNKQILKYLKMQNKFYKRLRDRCEEIINSGSNYDEDIEYYYGRSCEILNPESKWKEENSSSIFSNMIIEFLFERDSELCIGQKITGRQGNKGVISKILPDNEMPFLEDGTPIDVVLSGIGVINRLNTAQLFEQSINFISGEIKKKLRTLDDIRDKELLFFNYMKIISHKKCKELIKYYSNLDLEGQYQFFEDIDEHFIFVNMPPLWEDEPLFDKLAKIYKTYDWIKPLDVYVRRFGRNIKIMKPLIIGSIYMIKMKQTSEKNFSARSTGALSKKGVPDKSYRNKNHQELYSSTPVRIGEQENMNLLIGVPPEDIAKMHLFYRSSPIGRRELGEQLLRSVDTLKDFKYSKNFKNRNIEILKAYFKSMGIGLRYLDDEPVFSLDSGEVKTFKYNGEEFTGTKEEFEDFKLMKDVDEYFKRERVVIGSKEYIEKCKREEFEKRKTELKKKNKK